MDSIELSIFSSRMEAVCDEMGAVLRNAAFSPNIRDRLDFSCAVFDGEGELCAQAAHIPVHLGSMAFAMKGIVSALEWSEGDAVVLNDPYLGGTHLPDVTVIAPLFRDGERLAFVVNRAHHADIGAETPGSMPLSSSLAEEGRVIKPTHLVRKGRLDTALLDDIVSGIRSPVDARGDFAAQLSANRAGLFRLGELVERMGSQKFRAGLVELNAYGERLAREVYREIPDGCYSFVDYLDDDGQGTVDIPVRVSVTARAGEVIVDFAGTASQVAGNINCPLSVAAAGVFYVFRCLLPESAPACAGIFRPITLCAAEGCLVNALRPAAVAAGNVETSSRIVDAVIGALAQALPERMPAASHGSMNNLAMGSDGPVERWDYYETVGGGMGGGPRGGGLSGVQTHMTNTRNTPIEVLESRYPVRIERYAIRRGSGGKGHCAGGDGLVREFRFLRPTTVSLLTERRLRAPWGMAGGEPGSVGRNLLNGQPLGGKESLQCAPGDVLAIETPGGGGWGATGERDA